eukprot:GHVP01035267.1.p1 GENE.GHVP01035267.1~~GHVP01035267.1.p1  ORF type:complete len:684 (+),score=89.55 GHVP01035267.1:3-2054(+)
MLPNKIIMQPYEENPQPKRSLINRLSRVSLKFPYAAIKEATENFADSQKLGHGANGKVYKGVLKSGTEIAVKVMEKDSSNAGFEKEIEVLSKFRHPHLVTLLGFSEHRKINCLVYEYLEGGDLSSRLQRKKDPLLWQNRLQILLESAKGLSHLHSCFPRVFHRDVKSANILLDRFGSPKLADFGLACLTVDTYKNVPKPEGTPGYADPRYIQSLRVSESSEVYSFGAVILEVITSKPPAVYMYSNNQKTVKQTELRYLLDELNPDDFTSVIPLADASANFPPDLLNKLAELVYRCINDDEKTRLGSSELVRRLANLKDEFLGPKNPRMPLVPVNISRHPRDSSQMSEPHSFITSCSEVQEENPSTKFKKNRQRFHAKPIRGPSMYPHVPADHEVSSVGHTSDEKGCTAYNKLNIMKLVFCGSLLNSRSYSQCFACIPDLNCLLVNSITEWLQNVPSNLNELNSYSREGKPIQLWKRTVGRENPKTYSLLKERLSHEWFNCISRKHLEIRCEATFRLQRGMRESVDRKHTTTRSVSTNSSLAEWPYSPSSLEAINKTPDGWTLEIEFSFKTLCLSYNGCVINGNIPLSNGAVSPLYLDDSVYVLWLPDELKELESHNTSRPNGSSSLLCMHLSFNFIRLSEFRDLIRNQIQKNSYRNTPQIDNVKLFFENPNIPQYAKIGSSKL